MDCIFCKIIAGEVKADIVKTGESVIAFRDIHPKAPVHILIIPKIHRTNLLQISDGERQEMLDMAAQIATEQGIEASGYRVAMNLGRDAGQEVQHLHLHLMGGRPTTALF